MREHHAFWFAGRARGVDDGREFVRFGLQLTSVRCGQVRAVRARVLSLRVEQASTRLRRHSLRLKEDYVLDFGTFAKSLFQFIKLLAIFEKENARARIVQDVTHLRRR